MLELNCSHAEAQRRRSEITTRCDGCWTRISSGLGKQDSIVSLCALRLCVRSFLRWSLRSCDRVSLRVAPLARSRRSARLCRIRRRSSGRISVRSVTSRKCSSGCRRRTSRRSIRCTARRGPRRSPTGWASDRSSAATMCTQCHYTRAEPGRARCGWWPACRANRATAGRPIGWRFMPTTAARASRRRQESAEHRAKRVEESIARGMNNPHNIYLIARQCYDCHTVPNERLVNVGRPPGGQPGF